MRGAPGLGAWANRTLGVLTAADSRLPWVSLGHDSAQVCHFSKILLPGTTRTQRGSFLCLFLSLRPVRWDRVTLARAAAVPSYGPALPEVLAGVTVAPARHCAGRTGTDLWAHGGSGELLTRAVHHTSHRGPGLYTDTGVVLLRAEHASVSLSGCGRERRRPGLWLCVVPRGWPLQSCAPRSIP